MRMNSRQRGTFLCLIVSCCWLVCLIGALGAAVDSKPPFILNMASDRKLPDGRGLAPLRPFSFTGRSSVPLSFLSQWFIDVAGQVDKQYSGYRLNRLDLDSVLASTPFSVTVSGQLSVPLSEAESEALAKTVAADLDSSDEEWHVVVSDEDFEDSTVLEREEAQAQAELEVEVEDWHFVSENDSLYSRTSFESALPIPIPDPSPVKYKKIPALFKVFPGVQFENGHFLIQNPMAFRALVNELAFLASYSQHPRLGPLLPRLLYVGFHSGLALFALDPAQSDPRLAWSHHAAAMSLAQNRDVMKTVLTFYGDLHDQKLIHASDSILGQVILGRDANGIPIVTGICGYEQVRLESSQFVARESFYVSPEGQLCGYEKESRKVLGADSLWFRSMSFTRRLDLFNLGTVATWILAAATSARVGAGDAQAQSEAASELMLELAGRGSLGPKFRSNRVKLNGYRQLLLFFLERQRESILSLLQEQVEPEVEDGGIDQPSLRCLLGWIQFAKAAVRLDAQHGGASATPVSSLMRLLVSNR